MIVHNPILKGFYPDPSICRVGEDYYLVNSTFSYVPGIPVFHSRDLAHWEQIGNVLERKSQLVLEGAEMSRGIYAPTIRYHRGLFYVVTTNVSYGGNFYVTAKDPAGPWSDPVYLKAPEGMDGGIDPSLYFEGDRCFYIGQRQKKDSVCFGDCEIWLQELDLEKGELTGEDYSLYAGAMKDARWAEGPHLYRIGEYYYLTCAEQGTGYEHCISVARSRQLTGPYENYRCNPLVTHRHLGHDYPIQNIGHGDLVDTLDGKWYLVVLGTRPVNGTAELGRETFLAQVSFEDGWPVVNPGEGRICREQAVELPEKPLFGEGEGRRDACEERGAFGRSYPVWQQRMEMKFTDPLDKRFLFFRHPGEEMYRILQEEELLLKMENARPYDREKTMSYMGLRQQSREFAVSAGFRLPADKNGEAGLLYLHDDDNYLCFVLKRDENGLQAAAVRSEKKEADGAERKETLLGCLRPENSDQNTEWITLTIRGHAQKVSLYVEDRLLAEDISTQYLSSERAGGFVGCTFGIYAFGDGTQYAGVRNLRVKYNCIF